MYCIVYSKKVSYAAVKNFINKCQEEYDTKITQTVCPCQPKCVFMGRSDNYLRGVAHKIQNTNKTTKSCHISQLSLIPRILSKNSLILQPNWLKVAKWNDV
ncbi:uncharacterized protein LOC124555414 [Schistocerca americana]|uniref:uncharacterized protein LOC124555414 n=1 Tax=Schistocerca americana TaxID=7009 RepID=UPI001F4FEE72|nr:uncharacterized protein LOC124555414 [Schistocerca americana]